MRAGAFSLVWYLSIWVGTCVLCMGRYGVGAAVSSGIARARAGRPASDTKNNRKKAWWRGVCDAGGVVRARTRTNGGGVCAWSA